MLNRARASLATALIMSLSVTACAAQAVGDRIELSGKLVLRGPSGFATPTLVTKDSGVWQLEGAVAEYFTARQNTQVAVYGIVTRLADGKALPPVLQVEAIKGIPAK